MGRYTLEQNLEILETYFQSGESSTKTVRNLRKKFAQNDWPSVQFVHQFVKRFRETGSVMDKTNRSRSRPVRTAEIIAAVAQSVREHPTKSTRHRCQELDISRTSLRRILHKDLGLKAYNMPIETTLDKDAIREAYEDVRSDLTDTEWAVFKFDGPRIICTIRGQCFEEFRNQFADNERAFGYIRIQMGDEMSKRKKFIFLTWIGQEVGAIQRAKMSTDKTLIKDVLNNFAVELQAGVEAELDIELFRDALNRSGGAS